MTVYLQSYVLPVCLYEASDAGAVVCELIGTAFFINGKGVFLTAAHVMKAAVQIGGAKQLQVGLVVKRNAGTHPGSDIAPISSWEAAPAPYDVAIGVTSYRGETILALKRRNVEVWQDVATMGYPLHAVSGPADALSLNLRAHKGYIQRLLKEGDVPLGTNPPGFELSFLLSRGISGAPLFIHADPYDTVIGVCVGSVRTELIEDEYTEITDEGKTFKEMKVKIEEYGVAHGIDGLLEWRPSILGGASLLEASDEV